METNSKTGGVLPSVMALNASLNQRLGTSHEPTMLTPYEQKLLRQAGEEADALFEQSSRLTVMLTRLHNGKVNGYNAESAEKVDTKPRYRNDKFFPPSPLKRRRPKVLLSTLRTTPKVRLVKQ